MTDRSLTNDAWVEPGPQSTRCQTTRHSGTSRPAQFTVTLREFPLIRYIFLACFGSTDSFPHFFCHTQFTVIFRNVKAGSIHGDLPPRFQYIRAHQYCEPVIFSAPKLTNLYRKPSCVKLRIVGLRPRAIPERHSSIRGNLVRHSREAATDCCRACNPVVDNDSDITLVSNVGFQRCL